MTVQTIIAAPQVGQERVTSSYYGNTLVTGRGRRVNLYLDSPAGQLPGNRSLTEIGVLPESYRPAHEVSMVVPWLAAATSAAWIDILPTGSIKIATWSDGPITPGVVSIDYPLD